MSQYTGEPTDTDIEIANGLVESERPLCQDDAEYVAWALAGACKACKRAAGVPSFGGLCIACSSAVIHNHGRPWSEYVPRRLAMSDKWDGK